MPMPGSLYHRASPRRTLPLFPTFREWHFHAIGCMSLGGSGAALAGTMRHMSVVEGRPVERIVRPFQDFAHKQSSGGILLIAAAVVAIVWANSPLGESYAALWHTKLTIGVGEFSLSKDLTHWINDGLMAMFFLVVGLEIKRELLVGELSSVRGAALPVVAALGGAVAPALIYSAINAGGRGAAGWGIPMATDIAFALGVLTLLGERAPVGLKVFLTALAIVDDIVAVL